MNNINTTPINWDDGSESKLLGSLFPSGLNNSNYQNQTTKNQEIVRKNPLANSPLSKNGNDVRDNFFGGSKIENYNNFQIIIDPSSNVNPKDKIEPLTHTFYRDSNHNGIQDNGEYDIKVKLFISKIKEQLDDVYNNPTIKPEPREILLFLEDNTNDFSGTTLYIKKGNLVDSELSNLLSKSNLFSDYINSKYKISSSDLKDLLLIGKVSHPIRDVLATFVEIAAYFTTNPVVLKEISGGIKKGIDFIKHNCLIEEKNWNPKKVEKDRKFEPLLFSGVSDSLKKMDDQAINNLLNEGIKNLNTEMKKYDVKVKEALDIINKVPIPILLPLIPVPVPTKIPETFTDALWNRYVDLRKTMDKILVDVEKLDFSTILNEGANIINAFICGVWNGFIEAVCGIISLVQYLFEGAEFFTDLLRNFKTKGPELLEKIDDIILKFQEIDFGKIFTKLVANIKEWILSDSSFSLTEIVYFSGMFIGIIIELVIEIVVGILFTGGTLTIETILVKLGETFKALGNLLIGVLKLPAKVVGKTVSVLYNALHWVYEFLAKGTDELLRIVDEVFDAFKAYGKESLGQLNSQIPLLGKAELELYKKLISIFYKGFKNLLIEYIDIAKVVKDWERLKTMRDLSKSDIEMMLEWRKTLVGETEAANVAIMKQKVKVNGEFIELEYKAFAGNSSKYSAEGFCKKPNKQYIAKQLGLSEEELMKHYETLEMNGTMRRFFDSEHKIFAQNDQELHILFTKYGKENVEIIEQNFKTFFEPCPSCKKQFIIRQKLYDIKNITIEATRKNKFDFVKDNKEFLETLKKI